MNSSAKKRKNYLEKLIVGLVWKVLHLRKYILYKEENLPRPMEKQ